MLFHSSLPLTCIGTDFMATNSSLIHWSPSLTFSYTSQVRLPASAFWTSTKKNHFEHCQYQRTLIHPDRPEIIRTKDKYRKKQSQISYNQHHIIFTFHLNVVICITLYFQYHSFWISWTILKYGRGFFLPRIHLQSTH